MKSRILVALSVGLMGVCVPDSATAQNMTAMEVTRSTSASASGLSGVLDQLMGLEASSLSGLTETRIRQIASPYAAPATDGLRRLSAAELDALEAPDGNAQWECLTEALYFEARGETVEGQYAVAEVILNRVDHGNYPDTVCGVVNQGTGRPFACQFTYTCDGNPENISDPAAWNRLGNIARIMIDGAPRDLTAGATHYHADRVNPRWASLFSRTAEIGVHLFYRQ